jgi:hypothetical protein
MAQAKDTAKEATTDAPRHEGRPMPAGAGPIEYRQKKGVHLADAGRVVKEAWVGRICGRSVRVYRGAPEGVLPAAVKAALETAGIEVGVVTLAELGITPRKTGIVNLSQQG